MDPFFDSAEDTLRDYLSTWQGKYPVAYLMFDSEEGKIRFYFTDLDTSRETPKSKWFSEDRCGTWRWIWMRSMQRRSVC
jgi:hypothetical protein